MVMGLYSPVKVSTMFNGELRECSPFLYIRYINDALCIRGFKELTSRAEERFPKTQRISLILREFKETYYLKAYCEMEDGFDDVQGLKDFLREQYSGSFGKSFFSEPVQYQSGDVKEDVFVTLWWDGAFLMTEKELDPNAHKCYDLHCRDCKYMIEIANTDETGHAICSFPSSYEPVALDKRCMFLPETSELRCGDCARLGNDFGCFTCSAEDPAVRSGDLCSGFIDKHEEQLMDILAFWKLHEMYDRKKIIGLLDKFEQEFKTPLD